MYMLIRCKVRWVKKAYNYTLSYKSLNKLEKIVNSQYDIKPNALQFILGKSNTFKGFNHNNISRLIKDLEVVKSSMSNPAMSDTVSNWVNNAQVMLNYKTQAQEKINNLSAKEADMQVLHKGNNAFIYKQNEFVIKKQKNINEISARHEAAMCNKYSQALGREAEALHKGNIILKPFMESKGTVTPENVKKAVKEMYNQGFFMADASPSNFIKTPKGQIVPVDFRLVFTSKDLSKLDVKIQKEMVKAYISGGYRYVPAQLKNAYRMQMAQLDRILKQESPLRNVNTMLTAKAGMKNI